jgi:NADH-quinone oxidoreductase subunit J
MTFEQIVFIIVSLFTLVSGILVVTMRNLFHAALAMMASFLGVAGAYILLDAGFLAAAQLLVYIGAISILVIFAIMLTRRLMQTHESPFNSQPVFGVVTAVITFAVIGTVLVQMNEIWTFTPPPLEMTEADFRVGYRPGPQQGITDEFLQDNIVRLGESFVNADQFVIPFEVASVLLLAAMVGAILIAWPHTEEDEL